MEKVTTRLRMRVSQTTADGKVHNLPEFSVQGEATIGDFVDIEKTLNKIVASDGTKFALTSWWADEEKVDG